MSSSNTTSWRPGCGRPHPAFDVAMEWFAGRLPKIGVQRKTSRGFAGPWHNESFVTWDTNRFKFKIPDLHNRFWRMYLIKGDPNPHVCSAATEEQQALMEEEVEKKFGTVEWLIPWATNGNKSRVQVPQVNRVAPHGSEKIYLLKDRRNERRPMSA